MDPQKHYLRIERLAQALAKKRQAMFGPVPQSVTNSVFRQWLPSLIEMVPGNFGNFGTCNTTTTNARGREPQLESDRAPLTFNGWIRFTVGHVKP